MKVLHIASADYTGAGLCAKRICKALLNIGIDSKCLVLEKRLNNDYVIPYNLTKWHKIRIYWIKALRFLHLYKFNRELNFEHLMKQYNFWGSLPVSPYPLHKHPLVKEADIIHLHYIDDFLDYPSFFAKVKKKIIWTQHDESINFGISHHGNAFNALPTKIKKIDNKYKKNKHKAIKQSENLTLVSLSNTMYEFNRSHNFTRNIPDIIINNSVDYHDFFPIDKNAAREIFGIPSDKIILLFVAADISDPYKGLRNLVSAVNQLNDSRLKICTVGLNNHKADDIENLIRLGSLTDIRLLRIAYSTADYFIMPSKQEAFAQTPLEAMACGLPVVAYPCSGMPELINNENGVICDGFDTQSLIKGITIAMQRNYSAKEIREYVISKYSPEKIANLYLKLYKTELC